MTNREWLESLQDNDFLEACERMVLCDCTCCIYAKVDCSNIPHVCKEEQVKWLNAEHKDDLWQRDRKYRKRSVKND